MLACFHVLLVRQEFPSGTARTAGVATFLVAAAFLLVVVLADERAWLGIPAAGLAVVAARVAGVVAADDVRALKRALSPVKATP